VGGGGLVVSGLPGLGNGAFVSYYYRRSAVAVQCSAATDRGRGG